MGIDILSYTACKEITYAVTCSNCVLCIANQKYTCLTPNNAHESFRWFNNNQNIHQNSDASNVLCVTLNSACMCWISGGAGGTGLCCLWTVPTGATRAKFELWGPGAPGGMTNCCGAATVGGSGTYMSFEIPVTAGCQYTLCAGASNPHCPYCCGCSNYWTNGCYCTHVHTFVTGYGLCNVCVRGGYLDFVQNMCARLCRIGYTQALTGVAVTPCRFINEYYYTTSPNACGQCICQCVSLCNASQPSYYMHPVADWAVWPCGCVTIGLCQFTPILRIPMFHGGQCINTSNQGLYGIMPPMIPIHGQYGWCIGGMFAGQGQLLCGTGSCIPCAQSYAMECCCISQPGMPGFPTSSTGGTTASYADRGRHGAVKVTWAGNGTANNTLRCTNMA